MFRSKEKMGLKVFVYKNHLPLLEESVSSEADLLYEEIEKNNPEIQVSIDQVRFELFLLFYYLSGRGLSKIKGLDKFDSEIMMKHLEFTKDIFDVKFADIPLNPFWVDDKQRVRAISNVHNYYLNKTREYRKVELSLHKNEITELEFNKRISEIFLSTKAEKIDESIITTFGEIHKGGFMILYKQLTDFSQKYQIILDN